MEVKSFFKDSKIGFILLNLLIAILLVVVILVFVMMGIRRYTMHGQEVTIPDITGMNLQEATLLAHSVDQEVIAVDSTFTKKVPLGAIVEQTPPSGSHAKPGRQIYVVINSNSPRMIPLPDLRDMSYRQAEATLISTGLKVANIEYEVSAYKDLVLDVRKGDKSVEAGERFEEGSGLILVVGAGAGTEMVSVPSLRGKHLNEVRDLLRAQRLIVGSISYDVDPTPENESQYIVYWQSVEEGDQILEGSSVNIKLSRNIEKALTSDNQQSEEQFF